MQKQIFKSGANTFIVKIIGMGLSLLVTLMIGQVYGMEALGTYSLLVSYAVVLSLPVKAGLPIWTLREVAKRAEKELGWARVILSYSLKYVHIYFGSILGVLILLAVYQRSDASGSDLNTFILSFLFVYIYGWIYSINSIRTSVLQGIRSPALSFIPELLVIPVSSMFFMLVSIYTGWVNVTGLIGLGIFSIVTAYVAGLIILKNTVSVRTDLVSSAPRLSIDGKTITMLSLFGSLSIMSSQVSFLVLGNLSTHEEVAVFKVAIQLSNILTIPIMILSVIISPYVSSYFKEKRDAELSQLITKATRFGMMLSAAGSILLYVAFTLFASSKIGGLYQEAVFPLMVLCVANVFFAYFGAAVNVANMIGLDKESAISAAVGLISNIIVCWVLVPEYGAVGAAFALAIGTVLWKATITCYIYKRARIKVRLF